MDGEQEAWTLGLGQEMRSPLKRRVQTGRRQARGHMLVPLSPSTEQAPLFFLPCLPRIELGQCQRLARALPRAAQSHFAPTASHFLQPFTPATQSAAAPASVGRAYARWSCSVQALRIGTRAGSARRAKERLPHIQVSRQNALRTVACNAASAGSCNLSKINAEFRYRAT